jgi:protein-arginine kinase activator protein McsA
MDQEITEGTETQEEVKEEVQLSEVEIQAMELGWKPKEDFEAEEKNAGKKWRPAEEFIERKSFFDKIESQNHKIKTLEKGLQALGQHYTNVEKAAFRKALDTLKEQRKEALENQDLVKAEEIRDEMDEIKEKINSTAPPVIPQGPPPALVEWKQKNTWYQTDDRMTRYADRIGKDLFEQGVSPDEILKEIEKEVRETFPEKFRIMNRNPNKDAAPEVVPSGKKAGSSGSTGFRLPAEHERILNNMIRSGAPITREQYIKDLKAMGEI